MTRAWLHYSARVTLTGIALCSAGVVRASAQTDYYNTDAGRPVTVEDAAPVERRAFEIQAAPLRLERPRPGVYAWGLEPEVAYGILPRTQIELGLPLVLVDAGDADRTSGLAGLDVSVLHNFNVETSVPALAVAADVLFPVGRLAPDRAYLTMRAIATRTLTWGRFHLNGGYTVGDEPEPATGGADIEVSRWLAGLAVDRAFALRSTLLTAEVVARQPIHSDEGVEWAVGGGVRHQLTVRWAVDAGIGRRLTGDAPSWYATFGSAFAFGLPWQR